MIHSMTGYGQASIEANGVVYTVEIRTVNNRYLKTNLRLSDFASFCEDKVEKLLRKELSRGSVNFSLRTMSVAGELPVNVDELTLGKYIDTAKKICEQKALTPNINIGQLYTLPGVLKEILPDQQQAELIKQDVIEVTARAIENLKTMRLDEGKTLVKDLLENCDKISQIVNKIKTLTDRVVKQYHERLSKRTAELLEGSNAKIDEDVLAREVAIFAERADIAEELTRLDSHIEMFKKCCDQNGDSGRQLDFITQEMLREANTIASKASDSEICQLVIEVKCAIDRIKEQVQNVE